MLVDNLALVSAAAFAAIALYISLVEHPARLGLSDRGALAEWQPAYKGGAMIQAPLALLGGVFGFLAYALTSDWVWLLGSTALLANVPYTLIVIKPVNDALLAMEHEAPGAEARSLLQRWGRLHWTRTLLGIAATALFVWVAV
jgi:hypothetical protein